MIWIKTTIFASHEIQKMSVTRFEIPKLSDLDVPFDGRPGRTKLLTALGWFAILGLVAAVISATFVFTA